VSPASTVDNPASPNESQSPPVASEAETAKEEKERVVDKNDEGSNEEKECEKGEEILEGESEKQEEGDKNLDGENDDSFNQVFVEPDVVAVNVPKSTSIDFSHIDVSALEETPAETQPQTTMQWLWSYVSWCNIQ